MSILQVIRHNLAQLLPDGMKGGTGVHPGEMVAVLPKDAIQSIFKPVFISGTEACAQMTESEKVMGLEINGEYRAYPVNILSVHEIVNDRAGEMPFMVTWCPLSYTCAVYARTLLDSQLHFGVSGNILRNGLVMYDEETSSQWSQFTGEAISGSLAGSRLNRLPAVLTTWDAWYREFPESIVLSKEASPFGFYEEDHMSDYYQSGKTGIRAPLHRDKRIVSKEIVVGLTIRDDTAAYPFTVLKELGVLHDTLGGENIVVFYDGEAQCATVFDGKIDGTSISFHREGDKIIDDQTGSVWSALSGSALSGPLQGQRLRLLPATTSFWFVWRDYFPVTRLYAIPAIH